MADVQKEPLALLLAVVAEIDPRRSLFADDPAHRLASEPVEFGRVNRFASRLAHIEAGQLRRAWQAAGMGRKDAVFTAAHCPSLSAENSGGCRSLLQTGAPRTRQLTIRSLVDEWCFRYGAVLRRNNGKEVILCLALNRGHPLP